MAAAVGEVSSLWRFPVKSMLGERLDTAEVTPAGIVGDRAWALVEVETGRVLSGKTPGVGRLLLACRARFVEPPAGPEDRPPVRIVLPDGTEVAGDDPGAGAVLSRFLGRDVRLAASAPSDFTIEQYHPDVDGLDPAGHRNTVTQSKLGAPLFADLGLPPAVPAGAFVDVFPVSVITTGMLSHLGELAPGPQFDERRFRMNLVVRSGADGFVENDWPGNQVAVGGSVRLDVAMPDPRCVMVTLAQEDLPEDTDVLRALARNNRLEVAGGRYPCAGVYATVAAGGTVRPGDPVTRG